MSLVKFKKIFYILVTFLVLDGSKISPASLREVKNINHKHAKFWDYTQFVLINFIIPPHQNFLDPPLGWAQTLKNSAVFTEIGSEFWAEIGNSNDFSAQNQVISKKKKVFIEIESGFSAQNQVISKKKKKKKVFTEIESGFSPVKPLALLLLYCLITVMCAITEKKLQLNIVRLTCHNFLSLVEFWLGGAPPWLRLCTVQSSNITLQQTRFVVSLWCLKHPS